VNEKLEARIHAHEVKKEDHTEATTHCVDIYGEQTLQLNLEGHANYHEEFALERETTWTTKREHRPAGYRTGYRNHMDGRVAGRISQHIHRTGKNRKDSKSAADKSTRHTEANYECIHCDLSRTDHYDFNPKKKTPTMYGYEIYGPQNQIQII